MSSSAEINLFEKIPLILTVVDKVTGKPVPNASLSNVVWNQDNAIGNIIPHPDNPNLADFIPSSPGTTHITATATVTIN